MKTRLDFVSNSSSSSFMLVGCAFEYDDLVKAWQKLHPEDTRAEDSYEDDYELVENIANALGLNFHCGISEYYDMWVIGLGFGSMQDDETKKQFKDRIKTALSRAFGDVEVCACVDGGMDN